MSPLEHYFENLITLGTDVNGEPNKNILSKEVQEAVEICADYIRFEKLHSNTILENIKNEIENTQVTKDGFLMHKGTLDTILSLINEHIKKDENDQ